MILKVGALGSAGPLVEREACEPRETQNPIFFDPQLGSKSLLFADHSTLR